MQDKSEGRQYLNITEWRSAKKAFLNKVSVCRTRAKEDNTYSGAAFSYARRQVSNMINFRYLIAHVNLLKCRVRSPQHGPANTGAKADWNATTTHFASTLRLQESRQDLSGYRSL